MSRKLAIAAVLVAGFMLLTVIFFADSSIVEPEGISASDRYRCERLIEVTRTELGLLQEKLNAIQELRETVPKSETAELAKVDAELSATQAQLTAARQRLVAIENALAEDSRDAMEAVLGELKSL